MSSHPSGTADSPDRSASRPGKAWTVDVLASGSASLIGMLSLAVGLLVLGLTGSGWNRSPVPDAKDPTAVRCESPPTNDELRGVWLTNVDSDVLDSQANIEAAMAFLAAHDFNVVYPVV